MTVTQLPPSRELGPPAYEANAHPHRRSVLLAVVVAVIVGVLVLGGAVVAGGITTERDRVPLLDAVGPSASAAGEADAALPSRLSVPSPWLPVDETPGRAAVLIPGEHETLFSRDRQGAFAVSATTGAYTWLPLPGLSDRLQSRSVLLSPDGGRVAYWGGAGQTYDDPTALVVRDLTTGAESRHLVRRGATIEPSDLVWDGDALVYAFRVPSGERDLGGGSFEPLFDEAAPERWDLTTGEVIRGDRTSRAGSTITVLPEGYAMTSGYGRPSIGPLAFGDAEPVPIPTISNVLDIGRLLVTDDQILSASSGNLLSAAWPEASPGRVRARDIRTIVRGMFPGPSVTQVLGLPNPGQVVVRRDEVRNGQAIGRLERVALRDGRTTPLVRGAGVVIGDPGFGFDPVPSYATDLLAVPTADRPAPPEPIDQKAVAERIVRTLLVCLIAIAVIVAIRRPRRQA